MKVNLFQTQDKDFKVLLNRFGKDVLVNNVKTRVIITNTNMNELDNKYITADSELKRGDHVVVDGMDYYVINQVKTRRYESYNAIIRCAEHYIRFNLSYYDGIGEYTSYDVKEVPCIVSTTQDFGLDFGKQMILADGELALFIQDNATTRAIYTSMTTKSKHDIIIDDRQYEYIGFDFISKGILKLNVKVASKGIVEDNISWHVNSIHDDWNGFIDSSFYTDEGDIPVVIDPPVDPDPEPETPPVDPNRTETNVGTITWTQVEASSSTSNNGSLTVSWSPDPLATKYHVILSDKSSGASIQQQEITRTSVTFSGLYPKGFNFKVATHSGTKFLTYQLLNNLYVGIESSW